MVIARTYSQCGYGVTLAEVFEIDENGEKVFLGYEVYVPDALGSTCLFTTTSIQEVWAFIKNLINKYREIFDAYEQYDLIEEPEFSGSRRKR